MIYNTESVEGCLRKAAFMIKKDHESLDGGFLAGMIEREEDRFAEKFESLADAWEKRFDDWD